MKSTFKIQFQFVIQIMFCSGLASLFEDTGLYSLVDLNVPTYITWRAVTLPSYNITSSTVLTVTLLFTVRSKLALLTPPAAGAPSVARLAGTDPSHMVTY